MLRESLNQPLIVVFEDLHWIDGETQTWLNLLTDSLANARVLLLVNYRPEYRHRMGQSHLLYAIAPRSAGGRERRANCSLRCSVTPPSLAALRRMIAERTEGNPFFIEEMVQALFDDGTLARNGAVRLVRALAEIKVPATVQGIVASRIDRLPADEKELLQTLAVVGREFPRGLITRMVKKPDSELDRMLSDSSACASSSTSNRRFPKREYIFKHALTLEVAYKTLLLGRRKQLHEYAAEAIEALYSGEAGRSLKRSGASLWPERERVEGGEIPSPCRTASRRASGLR